MNNELESILSYYYYGPTDVWDNYVKAVEKWARNERANAWEEGYEACAHYHSCDTEHSAPNPHQEEPG